MNFFAPREPLSNLPSSPMRLSNLPSSPMRRDALDAPLFRRDAPSGNSFVRFVTASAIAAVRRSLPLLVAADLWPSDRNLVELLERAASAPAMTSVTGWAAELAQRFVIDALEALGPYSIGAEVLKRCLVVDFNGKAVISAPGFVSSTTSAGFVAEGDPIPVRNLVATAAQLLAHKLASIAVLTREMIESSNAEAIVGDTLMRSAGLALTAALFDNSAASAARPAGLLNGISATTASNNTELYEAFFEDTANLINAVATVGGDGPYALITSSGRAAIIRMRQVNPDPQLLVFGTSIIPDNVLIMVACPAVVAALDPAPGIETGNAATLHMDTAPSSPMGPGPVQSMFQIDAFALKMRWPVTWALRNPAGVAWLNPTWK